MAVSLRVHPHGWHLGGILKSILLAPVMHLFMVCLTDKQMDRLIIIITNLCCPLADIKQQTRQYIRQIVAMQLAEKLRELRRPGIGAEQADFIGKHAFDRFSKMLSDRLRITVMRQSDKRLHRVRIAWIYVC